MCHLNEALIFTSTFEIIPLSAESVPCRHLLIFTLPLGCLRNSVNRKPVHFFTSVHSICGTELAKIPRNYTEFRVAELHIVPQFRRISQNFVSVT
jgi:hypothetical protein